VSDAVTPEFVALQQAVAGRYSLERELGRGGMGIVFLARDVALDRLVAIKLLPPALATRSGLTERFLAEARTAARLSHPNIVALHSVEEASGLVFFVMAFIDGETVGDRLRGKGPLTPHDAARMIQEVAWALGYAHGRGVVHRDVKPDNIMLERASGRAIVMDFGIAGAAGGAAEAFGTAQYVSPEQAGGQTLDGRSDLYSLGVVAFLSLTGRLPFDADDPHSLLAMHVSRPAPPVLSVSPGMPRKLARAVDRCLAKQPGDRFPDGEALAESVAEAIEPPREIPAAVRVWMTRNTQPTVAHLFYIPLVTMPSGMAAVYLISKGTPLSILAGVGVLLVGLSGPFAITALYRFIEMRRLLGAGYSLEDIRLALQLHAQRRREELAVEFAAEPPLPARILRQVTNAAGWAIAPTMLVMFLDQRDAAWVAAVGACTVIFSAGSILRTFFPGIRLMTDRGIEWRLKFWKSKLGRWFEKLSRFGLKKRSVPAELTYRPTEMAIGLAADSLFESLPKEQRRELKELPGVLERLQRDASLMRKTVDDLNGALAGLGEQSDAARSRALHDAGGRGAELDETRTRLRAEISEQRDEAASRLAAAVSALESVRLSLLRLKAGTGTVTELTADLGAARSLTETIEYTVHGNAEVEKLFKPYRTPPGPLQPNNA
jgi:serine/threonine-protein kinase